MLSIRPGTRQDAGLLRTLIAELAEYERLSNEAVITVEDIVRDGFGPQPRFRTLIAEWEGEPAGYACFFGFYSTFQGRPGLHLEDIYVRPEHRGRGIGKRLLSRVSEIALDEGCTFVRWDVLDWNTSAIEFYRKLGAQFLDEWKMVILMGSALRTAAGKTS
ncbi:MAG: GNAT family N-acetyltransferase [Acidobacteriales bacterium]|nr:GNAT family N-acetyltransferase [Terriglobales bacterium]